MAKTDYRRGDLSYIPGDWFPMPRCVLESKAYGELSSSAIRLLFDVCSQISAKNNGRLSPTWELMKHRGWKSRTTLQKAKEELRASKLITVTRIGTTDKNNCELWAVNWIPLRWDKSMDIDPKAHNLFGFLNVADAKIDPIPERRKPKTLQDLS